MPRGSLSFVQVGLPIFGLVIGGSLAISYFLQGKYDIKVGCAACRAILRY